MRFRPGRSRRPRGLGFGEAAMMAFALHDGFGRGHVAAVLDPHGRPRDLTVFASVRHTVLDAVEHALDVVLADPSATSLLMLSAVPPSVRDIREVDLHCFRRTRALFEPRGFTVIDWFKTDGHDVRSIAMTVGESRWGEDGRVVVGA